MRAWLGVLLGCYALGMVQAADSGLPVQIRVASEVWKDHSNADGTGFAWDVLRAVYEPSGVSVQVNSMPYTRSVGLVQLGQADAVVGLYPNEVERVDYPRWPYAEDSVVALGLASMPVPSLQTLPNYRLIWMRGYDYQDQLPGLTRYQEIQRRDGVPAMLREDHADFYIDDDNEVRGLLVAVAHPEDFRITLLQRLPMYIGFAQTDRGRALLRLYEQRMDQLVRSGALRPIFQRWKEHYPYD